MKYIKDKTYDEERSLYALDGATLTNVNFAGPKDGESVLKEGKNLVLKKCYVNLRYPMWHTSNVTMEDCDFDINCRAGFWYCKNYKVINSKFKTVKPFRECDGVELINCKVDCPETFWRCNNIKIKDTSIGKEYPFFECKNLKADGLKLGGKYSLQYGENFKIKNSKFDTKDAFWHCKNVEVRDSVLIGQYIGWYSENLTFINCKISSHQPFCYCKNLKMINCEMIDCDLSFEYSSIDVELTAPIDSIKNVESGILKVPSIKEIINTKDSKIKSKLKIIYK